ncbi:MAG: NADH-quinone oxidoreductase subunit H, partial [Nitrospinae bacterium]|nr:NADH-quinone oxidoreductase subunit H [Nitrospinota bacterium]
MIVDLLITLVKILFILAITVGFFAPVLTWVERKQSAVMQDRIGANRADILGFTALG